MSRTSLRAVSGAIGSVWGSAGHGRLREALGWQEETYWRVREELIGDETIEAGAASQPILKFPGWRDDGATPTKSIVPCEPSDRRLPP